MKVKSAQNDPRYCSERKLAHTSPFSRGNYDAIMMHHNIKNML
jgi:hypothetical protein